MNWPMNAPEWVRRFSIFRSLLCGLFEDCAGSVRLDGVSWFLVIEKRITQVQVGFPRVDLLAWVASRDSIALDDESKPVKSESHSIPASHIGVGSSAPSSAHRRFVARWFRDRLSRNLQRL